MIAKQDLDIDFTHEMKQQEPALTKLRGNLRPLHMVQEPQWI